MADEWLHGDHVAVHRLGEGRPLGCLPGGPGASGAYLENLGGLDRHACLHVVDLPGTGAAPAVIHPADHQLAALLEGVQEARQLSGLTRWALLGHSAGTRVALQSVAADPDGVSALVLLTPPPMLLGDVDQGWLRSLQTAVRSRRGAQLGLADVSLAEASEAAAALAAPVPPPAAERARLERAARPLAYASWDDRTQRHDAALVRSVNRRAAVAMRAAISAAPLPDLARLDLPVLVVAGELDSWCPPETAQRLVGSLPDAELHVLPGAGHYPWVDAPEALRDTVAEFLARVAP